MRRVTKKFVILFCGLLFMVLYCEFLIYYVVIYQCYWPVLHQSKMESEVLKVLMITDIHLLGYRRGNLVDKWRREWQMHRAFQTIVTLHDPEVVFVLGDIFDEGEWASENEFNDYVKRFYSQFYVPNHIKMFIIVGNHDIGFHNNIKPAHAQRFYDKLNTTTVQFLTLKNNHFVLLNSMAMEGDNCSLCKGARESIEKISENLNCSQYPECNNSHPKINYSRPIFIQHFPMYRLSDAVCTEPDAVPWYEKDIAFRLKIDALSKESTDYLSTKIKPRAAFGGHTHYGCLVNHNYVNESIEFLEYSIPSFSWRNIFTPKYMLVTITPHEYAVNKCGLPGEHTIAVTAVIILFATIYIVKRRV